MKVLNTFLVIKELIHLMPKFFLIKNDIQSAWFTPYLNMKIISFAQQSYQTFTSLPNRPDLIVQIIKLFKTRAIFILYNISNIFQNEFIFISS